MMRENLNYVACLRPTHRAETSSLPNLPAACWRVNWISGSYLSRARHAMDNETRQAPFRMHPADERLGSCDGAGVQIDSGLVVQDELAPVDCTMQPCFDPLALREP